MSDLRAGLVADRASELEVDAVVVTDATNLRWLTGFTGSNGVAICGANTRVFVTDFRYTEQAADEVTGGFDVRIASADLFDEAVSALGPAGRLGFDPKQFTVARMDDLRAKLPAGWEAVGVADTVSPLRLVKETFELDAIAEAARIADAAFTAVVEDGLVGRTEANVAWDLQSKIRELGGEGVSFPPIVAAGAHGALPHASPRDVKIRSGTLVVIDWGAVYGGYCSDCTRTVATGAISDFEVEIHNLVLKAQIAGVAALRSGPTGNEIDSIARGIISAAGYGDAFGHGLGHGVGLDIHEGPNLGQRQSNVRLEPGMVVTVEPGIYLPGRFGVRIEDLCVIEPDGARVLTRLPLDIVEVG